MGSKAALPKLSEQDKRQLTWAQRKELAREMYYNYTPITTIALEVNIKLPTVKSWIYGQANKLDSGWKAERETAKNQLLKDLSSDKRGMVQNMVNGSLYLIHDYVEKSKMEAVKSGKPINIREAEKLTSILMNLHKIVQDERENSDDVNFTKPTSPKELTERIIKADPFTKNKKTVKTESSDDDIILEEDI